MILACKNIKKSFGIDIILEDVSFQIEENEKAAIVGINGAGKSTLFKILTEQLSADSGNIFISKETTLGYLSQNLDIQEERTIYEETLTIFSSLLQMESTLRALESRMGDATGDSLDRLMMKYSNLQHQFEEMNGYGYKSQIKGVLKGLGFTEEEFEQPIAQLSGGQKTRVALGKLLLKKPDILFLDEPTNHLDIQAIEWLEDFLKTYEGTVLLISHDRYFLDRIITKVVEIENRKSATYNGNYSFYAKHKELNREIQIKHYLDQQKEIKRQEEVIEKLRSFNREKSIKRARSREKLLDKVERIEKPEVLLDQMKLRLEPKIMSSNDVLHIENLKKSFDQALLFSNVSFDLKRGEKIALIGPNGVGKTTIFRILMNQLPSDMGTMKYGTNVKIGYYDQEQQNLTDSNTMIDEISDAFPTLTIGEIRNTLAAFLFTGDDVFKTIGSLSGGEKGRVSLAKIMLSGANFLLLDEPTNHLDMVSKEILENALTHYTGTVFYISHDRYFINKTAHKILELSSNGTISYLGNYNYYLEKKAELKESSEHHDLNIIESSDTKQEWLRKKEEQASIRKLQNQIAHLEENIQKIEAQISEVDASLCLEEVYSNPEKAQEAYHNKSILEKQLEELYEEWETLQADI